MNKLEWYTITTKLNFIMNPLEENKRSEIWFFCPNNSVQNISKNNVNLYDLNERGKGGRRREGKEDSPFPFPSLEYFPHFF